VQVLSWADEHEQIVNAVEAGDADLAERLARDHVRSWAPVEHE
jgi:DNA-binding GntR family transcriptional regulator